MRAIITRGPKGFETRGQIHARRPRSRDSRFAQKHHRRTRTPGTSYGRLSQRSRRERREGVDNYPADSLFATPPPRGSAEGNNRVSSFHPQSLPAIARGVGLRARGPCIIATPFRAIVTSSLKARRIVGEMLNKRSRPLPSLALRPCSSDPPFR